MNSSNSGVLRQPFVSTDAHVMGSRDLSYVDPVMSSRLENARVAGYEQGFADGARAAEAGARRAAESAQRRLEQAVVAARAELAATTIGLVPELLDLAISVARRIVDEVPDQLRNTLLDRISQALGQLDDDQLTLWVSAPDVAEITAGIGATAGITVRSDTSLGTGEARIEGSWCRADLTLPTAWRLVEEDVRG